jgi:hypothetical protein
MVRPRSRTRSPRPPSRSLRREVNQEIPSHPEMWGNDFTDLINLDLTKAGIMRPDWTSVTKLSTTNLIFVDNIIHRLFGDISITKPDDSNDLPKMTGCTEVALIAKCKLFILLFVLCLSGRNSRATRQAKITNEI